jgi:DtxR family transcriptional regulator, Mn-dependent transcriptional regulator
MSGHSHFEESIEQYMEAVYRLEREGPGVTTSGLATEMGVAPASASAMLKKLTGLGYLQHIARGEVMMTRKGLEVGTRVIRRHRLAERLLIDVLGMARDDVDTEACMLEHAITDRVEERLVLLLGDPKTCPHGHPIPPKDVSDLMVSRA